MPSRNPGENPGICTSGVCLQFCCMILLWYMYVCGGVCCVCM